MQALFRQTRLLMVLGKCRTKFPGLQGMSEMCLRPPPSARGAEGGWQAPRGGPKEGCKVVLSSSSGFKSHLAKFEFK